MITPHKHTANATHCLTCHVFNLIMELSEADKKKVAIFALSQTLNPEAFQDIAHVCVTVDRGNCEDY